MPRAAIRGPIEDLQHWKPDLARRQCASAGYTDQPGHGLRGLCAAAEARATQGEDTVVEGQIPLALGSLGAWATGSSVLLNLLTETIETARYPLSTPRV